MAALFFTCAGCGRAPSSRAHYQVMDMLKTRDYEAALREVNLGLVKKPRSQNLLEVKLLLLLGSQQAAAREAILQTQRQIDTLGGGRELLLEQAANRMAPVRQQTAYALGALQDPASLAVLKDLAEDTNSDVRAEAVRALAKLNRPEARNLLLIRLRDGYWKVRAESADALAHLGDPTATKQLFRALDDKDDYARMQVLGAVLDLAHVTQTKLYLKELGSDDQMKKIAAALSLGKIRRWEAVPVLLALLKDKDSPEKVRLAQCLMSFSTEAMPASFSDLLKKEQNPQVKEVYADFLKRREKVAHPQ